MKSRLIILSDLWGKANSDWMHYYHELLEPVFNLQYYDCCELGGVDTLTFNEEAIHSQFVNFGVEVAIKRLLELEKGKVSVLAFSIGGTIAWKAGLAGLKIENLYAISSTRLRYEINKPNCFIKLYYGNNDAYKPGLVWLENTKVPYQVISGGDHLIYTDKGFSAMVCKEIHNAHQQAITKHSLS